MLGVEGGDSWEASAVLAQWAQQMSAELRGGKVVQGSKRRGDRGTWAHLGRRECKRGRRAGTRGRMGKGQRNSWPRLIISSASSACPIQLGKSRPLRLGVGVPGRWKAESVMKVGAAISFLVGFCSNQGQAGAIAGKYVTMPSTAAHSPLPLQLVRFPPPPPPRASL